MQRLLCLKNVVSHILGLRVNRFPVFMDSEGSLPYSKQPDSENYPEPYEVNPQHNTCLLNDTIQIIKKISILCEDIYIFFRVTYREKFYN